MITSKADYRKLQPGDAAYNLVMMWKGKGTWVCDSWDHNEVTGCSNPECFKYPKRDHGKDSALSSASR